MNKWDQRFLELAQHVSTWSKDPSTQVGAVIARNKRFISLGFNGFAEGVEDLPDRLTNRDIKYKMIIHGEVNAMHFAQQSLVGCSLYTWPFMPCPVCAAQVINNKISRVIAPRSDNARWTEDFKISTMMFEEAGVELVLVDKN